MKKVKFIPAHVPFCHKNYDVAEALAHIVVGEKGVKPWNIEQKPWEAILEAFEGFNLQVETDSISCEWETVESFFQHLIDSAEKGESSEAESIALASIDSDNDSESDSQESPESILDLTEEVKDRETAELAKQTLEQLEGCDEKKLRQYKSIVEDAITQSLTRRRKVTEEDPDYKTFRSRSASLREFGRINEKFNFHPTMKTLALYRAMNGELTTIKPVTPEAKELFIMIDDSGSMDRAHKKAIVNLVILRAKRRTKKGVTVKVYSFESELYHRECDLSKELPSMGFGGGGTDVQRALTQLAERIQSKNASILVINDGEDSVSNNFKPVCRTCAITIGVENQGLANACKRSGGKYYNL